jgi:isoquinoline 1-oxidoreductase alpha subunit
VHYTIRVNGQARDVEADPQMPLLWVLRDLLELKGTKFGCGKSFCGACTVHLNGAATRACVTPISSVGFASITTIEAVAGTPVGRAVSNAWLAVDVVQCGYCQAGQIMSASALLAKNSRPTDADIDKAMSGNICRCATYSRIRVAIKQAAGMPTADSRDTFL